MAGLGLFAADTPVQIMSLVADQRLEASPVDAEPDVASVIEFLNKHCVTALIDFSCRIGGDIELTTHDDGECHFRVPSIADCRRLVLATVPPDRGSLLWNSLEAHPGCYITIDEPGQLTRYTSFDDYLARMPADGSADGQSRNKE